MTKALDAALLAGLQPYAGRWVALTADHQVAGTGETGPAALRAGRRNRPKVRLAVHYVPDLGGRELVLSPLLARLEPVLARLDVPVYLVGGAVRDALLGKISHDLDFAVPAGGINIAYQVGDRLQAPAFVLDDARDTGRVILEANGTYLDFVAFRGESLAADLHDRDLTINAMALPALARTTAELIDPTGGLADLAAGRVRQVHPTSLTNDPVRGLRALRIAIRFDFDLTPETETGAREALADLHRPSAERVRDELVNLLDAGAAPAVTALHRLGRLGELLPEIARLDGVEQGPPHHEAVLPHTISTLRCLETVLADRVFAPGAEPWRAALAAHLRRPVAGGLQGITLLRLGALFHDAGKADTRTVEPDGRVRFIGHEKNGADLAGRRLRALKFSREAIGHVRQIVRGHMRPLHLRQSGAPEARALHRYFRSTGTAGLDIALLALADHLATHDGPGPGSAWDDLIRVVESLFTHYVTLVEETVRPAPLITGRDLMTGLALEGGPEIGRLLRLLAEAQAAGEITTREEALAYARTHRRQ